MSLEPNAETGPLRIDPEIQRRIESYAHAVGATPAEVIRKAFEEYQAAHQVMHAGEAAEETAFDILSRGGLIGCIKGAPGTPTDLSTNPRHMKGFGRE
ncbi:MAG: hypothetical protein JOZ53_01920 [Planctomycetaceae bacterium]|nr:hypothetical protein [Planctomycetaceae bacterium]